MTWLAPLLHGLWAFHIVRGELNQALTHAEEMETLGKTRGNLSALLLGKHERGRICLHRGEFTTARALFEQCNALREPAHRAVLAAWVVQDRHIYNLGELGLTLALQGYIERGGMRLNEALTEARELKHPLTLVVALNEAAAFENIFGSPDRARRYAEELAAFSREQGFPYWAATADTYRGRSLCALGHLEEGLDFITKGLLMYRATGAQIGVSSCLTEQAAAYGALDRPLEGVKCLDEAMKIIDTNHERYWEAEVYRVRGELLVLDPKPDVAKAEAYFNRALDVARKQQAKFWELRGAISMARLGRDQGKRDEARELLAPIYGWFTEGFDTLDLKEAKTLLDELSL